MNVDIVIFDLDDVLCRYDLGARLRALARLSGKTPRDIRAALWDSGFEDAADSGTYQTAEEYLAEFASRLGHPISRDEWIAARRASIQPWPDMLALVREIARHKRVALYTNNGPLMKDGIGQVFPEAAQIFRTDCYFSFEFLTKKPDPESYRRLMQRLGVDAGNAWFTDDKKSNVEGARLAGLRAHHFTSRPAFERKVRELGLLTA